MLNELNLKTKKINRYAYIRGLLKAHGITHISIAREFGVTGACVSLVLSGAKKSFHLQNLIAKRLEMPFADLWGEAGKRVGVRKSRKKTRNHHKGDDLCSN